MAFFTDLLGERARLMPDKEALVFVPTGERLSYAELDARAEAWARLWVESWGLAKGDRVALLAHNSIEFVAAYFAAGKSGVVLVPLSTRGTAHELAPILGDAAPRRLIYEEGFAETVADLRASAELEGWHSLDDEAGSLRAELAAHLGKRLAPVAKEPDDLWCLLYTSGTTGRPKGVMVPHRMVLANGFDTAVCWDLRPDDRSPIFTPLYHAGGLGAFLLPIVTAGGTIVLHRGFEVGEVLRTIAEERCTVVLGVPTIYQMLLDSPELDELDLSHLRWFISGGAPMPPSLLAAYQERGFVLRQGYGLTEVGVNCFTMTDEDSVRKKGSIGRPLLMTEARILAEDGSEAADDEVGELCFRGPHVSLGYWHNPEATAEALDADGWFHTGDLARRDAEGFFYIAGRKKDMIISGGVNVYPIELETELAAHPGVRDVAVVGLPDPKWGETAVACVVADEGITAETLQEFLAPRLARFKIPRRFVFLAELPRTPYGKVVKGDLRRQLQGAAP